MAKIKIKLSEGSRMVVGIFVAILLAGFTLGALGLYRLPSNVEVALLPIVGALLIYFDMGQFSLFKKINVTKGIFIVALAILLILSIELLMGAVLLSHLIPGFGILTALAAVAALYQIFV